MAELSILLFLTFLLQLLLQLGWLGAEQGVLDGVDGIRLAVLVSPPFLLLPVAGVSLVLNIQVVRDLAFGGNERMGMMVMVMVKVMGMGTATLPMATLMANDLGFNVEERTSRGVGDGCKGWRRRIFLRGMHK